MASDVPLHIRQHRQERRAAILRRAARIAYVLSWAGALCIVWHSVAFPWQPLEDASARARLVWYLLAGVSPAGALLGLAVARALRRSGERAGMNRALAAVAVGAVSLPVTGVGELALGSNPHAYGQRISCLSNVKQVSLSLIMYSQDWDDRFPEQAGWNAALWPYSKNRAILACPEARPRNVPSYALSHGIVGRRSAVTPRPADTVLLLESRCGRDLVGGMDVLPDPARHRSGDDAHYTAASVDGHAKYQTLGSLSSCVWNPIPALRSEVLAGAQTLRVPIEMAPGDRLLLTKRGEVFYEPASGDPEPLSAMGQPVGALQLGMLRGRVRITTGAGALAYVRLGTLPGPDGTDPAAFPYDLRSEVVSLSRAGASFALGDPRLARSLCARYLEGERGTGVFADAVVRLRGWPPAAVQRRGDSFIVSRCLLFGSYEPETHWEVYEVFERVSADGSYKLMSSKRLANPLPQDLKPPVTN